MTCSVVVTGIGAVTPLGHTLRETLDALDRGESALREATLFDATGFRENRAAEVTGFDARAHFRVTKALKVTERKTRFAVAAASMALHDAGFPEGEDERTGLGVVLGVSGSDIQAPDFARAFARHPEGGFAEKVLGGMNPLWLLISLPNMVSAHAAIQLQARGPNSTVMTDFLAGLQAIGEAAAWIRAGEAKAVLAGGADSALFPYAYGGFQQAGLFDDGRFVPGEGAAVLLLEDADEAARRGARAYGEIVALAGSPREALAGWRGAARVVTSTVFAEPYLAWEDGALAAAGLSRTDEHTSRLGHALAAAGPIDAALLLGRAEGETAILAHATGAGGLSASLAMRAFGRTC